MRTLSTSITITAIQAAIISTVHAQENVPICPPYSAGYPACPLYSRPATADESWRTGVARIIDARARALEAQARANYLNAQAQLILERANAQAAAARAYNAADVAERQQKEKAARDERAAARRAQLSEWRRSRQQAAAELGSAIDQACGSLQWPQLLRHPKFAPQITAIEKVMAKWVADNHFLGTDDQATIRQNISEIESVLSVSRASIATSQYNNSRIFLGDLRTLLEAGQRVEQIPGSGT